MVIAGVIGVGIVWGWLLMRLIPHARFDAVIRLLLGLAGQLTLISALVKPIGILWFGIGTLIGFSAALIWFRTLEQRTMGIKD